MRKKIPTHLYKWRLRREVRESTQTFTSDDLVECWENGPLSGLQLLLVDENYRIVTPDVIDLLLERSNLSDREWTADTFDCDNFAVCLTSEMSRIWRVNVGIVVDFSGRHAYSAAFTHDGDGNLSVEVIEPQSDRSVRVGESDMYSADFGFALFV